MDVELLPSSRGAMLLRFHSMDDRETALHYSPIHHGHGRVTLERSEDTCNRFFRVLPWLRYLSVTDYPIEHWTTEHLSSAFGCLGHVREIDPSYVSGYNFSSVRLVMELEDDEPASGTL